ncbi:AAA family ATPase [uncultured Legionella sp.]|uniref:AAA family ATPase n=1 Tax=uncultured Legionella sp. TaxID=210934 RepID=UPI00261DBB1E|nr:ATP-binding protein [uncultured Legionella sp.]
MATAEQIKALIKSHAGRDDSHFYSVAMQMAAQAARQGHSRLANELRILIDEVKEQSFKLDETNTVSHISQPRGELAGLLSVSYPKNQLTELIVPENRYNRLQRILLEHRQRSKLAEHGLQPRRKILLFGPPGTGKTFTASILAGELHLPLYTILLDGLITKYMGETAAKLRMIFESIDKIKGVYFFDEFDAIGSHRTSQNDVGEIRRVLNSFLQFLEQSNSTSIILAATNNLELLDKALFRRFDDVIEYNIPDKKLAEDTFRNHLIMFPEKNIDFSILAEKSKGLSFAEICKVCENAIKFVILNEESIQLSTRIILDNIEEQVVSHNREING